VNGRLAGFFWWGRVGDKKKKYGNDSPDVNEENESVRYVFLFVVGRVLIRKKDFKSGTWQPEMVVALAAYIIFLGKNGMEYRLGINYQLLSPGSDIMAGSSVFRELDKSGGSNEQPCFACLFWDCSVR